MKPELIMQFPERVRDAPLNNKLGYLIDYLEDQQYMKRKLEEHFRKLGKIYEDIPLELDWVYAQYNITITTHPTTHHLN